MPAQQASPNLPGESHARSTDAAGVAPSRPAAGPDAAPAGRDAAPAGPDLSGRHVLVTGGAGFIGRTVVDHLLAAGAGVSVVDLDKPHHDAVTAVVGDLRDERVMAEAVTADVTDVVHLAAATSVLESIRQPEFVHDTNVTVTAGLAEAARRAGVDRLVFASSNAVTGDVGWSRIDESLALQPLTPYGATKAAGEMLLSGYTGSLGLSTCSLRLTNVYGPGMQDKDSFVPRLMRAARDGHGVEIYGDGEQVRDFVHVDDVARAFLHFLVDDTNGPVIVGAGDSISVLDLVATVRDVTGSAIPATHVAAKPGEMPAVIVDTSRARALGWEPARDLAAGLATVWAEFAPDDQ